MKTQFTAPVLKSAQLSSSKLRDLNATSLQKVVGGTDNAKNSNKKP